MNIRYSIVTLVLASCAVACSQQAEPEPPASEVPAAMEEAEMTEIETSEIASIESFDIAPGLSARTLKVGDGQAAQAGDSVEVHYTGWLYDEKAANNRGEKFDSSVDRGERFQFPLGAGSVIKGWDQGVAGMLIGELRELTIAPEMGYADRGAGNAIPPGATLVFEVELFGLTSLSDPAPD